MNTPAWEWCLEHGATTLPEGSQQLACGCRIRRRTEYDVEIEQIKDWRGRLLRIIGRIIRTVEESTASTTVTRQVVVDTFDHRVRLDDDGGPSDPMAEAIADAEPLRRQFGEALGRKFDRSLFYGTHPDDQEKH